jgi:DNA gyrase inhibitor GyrI
MKMPAMHIDKSIVIDAPVEKVFGILNNFHHWSTWSPWLICDPDSRVTVRQDGKFYEWEGQRVGSGNMEIVREDPGKLVDLNLTFLKPWKSKAKVQFICKPENQKTRVHWSMDSSLPFFMFWMKASMEAFVGSDYERGLAMLREYVETGKVSSTLSFIGESWYPGCRYFGIKTHTTIEQCGKQMEADMDKLLSYVSEKKIQPDGETFSIYHQLNFVKRKVSYTAGIPVSELPGDLPAGFITGEIPTTKIYTLRHTGSYLHLGNAWTTLYTMQRNKEFKIRKDIDPFEVYINMPGEVSDQELITDINFPIK